MRVKKRAYRIIVRSKSNTKTTSAIASGQKLSFGVLFCETIMDFQNLGPITSMEALRSHDALRGFSEARRAAGAQHQRRVTEAANLMAAVLTGWEDPFLLRQAMNPTADYAVAHLMTGLYCRTLKPVEGRPVSLPEPWWLRHRRASFLGSKGGQALPGTLIFNYRHSLHGSRQNARFSFCRTPESVAGRRHGHDRRPSWPPPTR